MRLTQRGEEISSSSKGMSKEVTRGFAIGQTSDIILLGIHNYVPYERAQN